MILDEALRASKLNRYGQRRATSVLPDGRVAMAIVTTSGRLVFWEKGVSGRDAHLTADPLELDWRPSE